MPTRVAEVNLLSELAPIGRLGGYRRVWILVRVGRRPVGWVRLPRSLAGAELSRQTLIDLVCNQLGMQVWEALLSEPKQQAGFTPPISVIVCTREHPEQLERQLKSLGELDYPNYEVVVVDNAPRTPRTGQVCAKFEFVRHIVEPQPGLDYARNTGWRSARHGIVAYTDDDAVVDPHWLSGLARNYADPQVLCVTGLTVPMELETPAQEFFEMYGGMGRGFRRREYRPGTWKLFYPLGSGCNMSIRRSFLEQHGGFDDALDTGSPTRGGGDLDMFAQVIKHGGKLVYEPLAICRHQHRRTMAALRGQMFDYGYGFAAYLAKYEENDLELSNCAAALRRRWMKMWGWQRLWRNIKAKIRMRPSFPLDLIIREMLGLVLGRRAYGRAAKRVQMRRRERETSADSEPLAIGQPGPKLAGAGRAASLRAQS